ncbi:vacuolar protein sorting/targeting protein PEP1 [Entomophthora muscae]|uniref:Vacuolar protein sorting/targeting protein PEP1 n=1 Tax=Entomophthora muscae TaxID=34485 RepID=A0ACC2U8N0_9FUNG|nr:vacuolar protein sorting/targeting protein PEP1 [Entomophthora muscae]
MAKAYYTTDFFSTAAKPLVEDIQNCLWGRGSKQIKDMEENRVFCSKSKTKASSLLEKLKNLQLVSSIDFTNFVALDFDKDDNPDGGVIGLSIKEKFLVAGVLFKSETGDTSLFVSPNGKDWTKANIPMQTHLVKERYTFLESTSSSLVLSVKPLGTKDFASLYFSDSEGVNFENHLDYVNRDAMGSVDVERMAEVLNLFIANVVSNHKEVNTTSGGKVEKKLQSRISFNNGLSWSPLSTPAKDCSGHAYKCSDPKACSLHLSSVTNKLGSQKVLSRPAAPGLLVGMGNVGDALKPSTEWDVFLSHDGGVTWSCTYKGLHEFAVANRGGLLVLGQSSTDHLLYSFDQGDTWKTYPLSTHLTQIKLRTVSAGISNIVLLSGKKSDDAYVFISLDFTDSLPLCQEKDFQRWIVPGTCFMGQKHIYKRRKPKSQCLVSPGFNEAVPSTEPCKCTKEDYECSTGFKKRDRVCVPGDTPAVCEKGKQISAYRKVPGNACTGGTDMANAHMQPCPGTTSTQAIGEIVTTSYPTTTQIVGIFNFPNTDTYLTWGRNGKLYSTYDGGLNWLSPTIEGEAHQIVGHEYNQTRAYVLTKGKTIFLALNQSQPPLQEIKLPTLYADQPLRFHPTHHDYLLFLAQEGKAYVSTEHIPSWSGVINNVDSCRFAETLEFSPSDDHVLCLKHRTDSLESPKDLALLDTDGKFVKTLLEDVLHFEIVGAHLLAELKEGHKFMVSGTDYKFTQVQLPPGTRPKGQFIMHSSRSAQSDNAFMSIELESAADGEQPRWGLYVSNSDGNQYSLSLPGIDVIPGKEPDLDLIQGVDGIVVANQLLMTDQDKHLVKSSISFDYGGSWNPIPLDNACDGCSLHLHVMPEPDRWWGGLSGVHAAGRILAVGNEGRHREDYEDSQTYASTDAGVTWTKVWPSESLYALGNYGNLMVLVDDEAPTDSLHYSIDGGKSWQSFKFSNSDVRATHLLAKQDGSSLRFIVVGLVQSNNGPLSVLHGVNFRPLYPDNCSKEQMESWSFKGPPPFNSTCILGQQLSQQRVKANSTCFLDSPPKLTSAPTPCTCTELDFECDFGFYRSNNNHGECIRIGQDPERPSKCPAGGNYTAVSGYRRVPASQCSGGVDLTTPVQRPCHEVEGIVMRQKVFEADLVNYFYFKASTKLLLHTQDSKVWISGNEGLDFQPFLTNISQMIHHTYIDNTAYFLTTNNSLYFTHHEGDVHAAFPLPAPPNTFDMPILNFHPQQETWAIFIGQANCDSSFSISCHTVAYLTTNSGKQWHSLATHVKTCSFTHTPHFAQGPKQRIFCQFLTDKNVSRSTLKFANSSLLYSDDDFATNSTSLISLIRYDTFYEFMIATESKPPEARLLVSKDGMHFSPAQYPPGVQIIPGLLTVAESDTHSLFVHFTTSIKRGGEMGALMKSDANGTNFVLSLDNVNRNAQGIMDYEKMAGIEGIALANQVSNPNGVLGSERKKLVSRITFDDGASWLPLNTSSTCSEDSCRLHILGFTQRSDPENIFSIPAAVGMMIGVGNTGEHLETYSKKNVYFTEDAGKSWSMIQEQSHRHEFGDSGGIILLVPEAKLTDKVLYSLDMGLSFNTLSLEPGMQSFRVKETATEPQSTSQKMLVLGYTQANKFTTLFIDFSNVHKKKCTLEDFELWTPSFSNDKCFFGHKTQYMRRKRDAKCYIDKKFEQPTQNVTHCPCTREDFECDFNHKLNTKGECQLVEGLEPLKTSCNNGEGFYTISTGYRKSAYTTCQGGEDLAAKQVPCPGQGLSKLSLFFIVIIPLSCLGFLLYAVVRRGYRRPIPWEALFQSIIPCLCFIPAMLVNCLDGPGLAFFGRLRGSFNRGQGYEPVPQYDYDLDEDYIDGPVEVQLEDYDIDQAE